MPLLHDERRTHLHVEEAKASLALHLSRVQHNGLHIRGQSLNLRLACRKKSKLRSQRFTLARACFVHSGARAGRVRWDEVVDGGAFPTPCFQPLLQCAAMCCNVRIVPVIANSLKPEADSIAGSARTMPMRSDRVGPLAPPSRGLPLKLLGVSWPSEEGVRGVPIPGVPMSHDPAAPPGMLSAIASGGTSQHTQGQ